MIDAKYAGEQVARFTGLDFFPQESAARKELVKAAQTAMSEEILFAAVSDWMESSSKCPKPAEIRAFISSRNFETQERRTKCQRCGGSGAVTIWRLVTYRGNSYVSVRQENLQQVTNQAQANEFTAALLQFAQENPNSPRQTVLTFAEQCSCGGVIRP